MEMACIRMNFQTIKYLVPIFNILYIILLMVANSLYDSKFMARYGEGSTALLFQDDKFIQ